MQEQTATITLSLTVTLTGEAGATPDQPYLTAEEKATAVRQIISDQVESIKHTYDTGVKVSGKLVYTGVATEQILG